MSVFSLSLIVYKVTFFLTEKQLPDSIENEYLCKLKLI